MLWTGALRRAKGARRRAALLSLSVVLGGAGSAHFRHQRLQDVRARVAEDGRHSPDCRREGPLIVREPARLWEVVS